MNNTARSSAIFIAELIFVIFCFSLCATLCIKAFAKAENMSTQAEDLNMSVIKAESIINEHISSAYIKDISYDTKEEYIYWDDTWQDTSKEYATYVGNISSQISEDMLTVYVSINKDNEEIYDLSAKKYIGAK